MICPARLPRSFAMPWIPRMPLGVSVRALFASPVSLTKDGLVRPWLGAGEAGEECVRARNPLFRLWMRRESLAQHARALPHSSSASLLVLTFLPSFPAAYDAETRRPPRPRDIAHDDLLDLAALLILRRRRCYCSSRDGCRRLKRHGCRSSEAGGEQRQRPESYDGPHADCEEARWLAGRAGGQAQAGGDCCSRSR